MFVHGFTLGLVFAYHRLTHFSLVQLLLLLLIGSWQSSRSLSKIWSFIIRKFSSLLLKKLVHNFESYQ